MDQRLAVNDRVLWLDVFKGIGIILIVLGHIYRGEALLNWLFTFHVALFFFASGWLYREREIRRDVFRRIRTILVPYFVLGLLIWVYWVFLERRFRAVSTTPAKALLALLLGEYPLLDPFHSHLWFLPCFFVTSVLYNILRRTVGKSGTLVAVCAMSGLYIAESFTGFRIPVLPWGLDRACWYIAFFYLGNTAHESGITDSLSQWNPFVTGICALVCFCFGFVGSVFLPRSGILWYLLGIIGIAGTVFAALGICAFCTPRILPRLGQATLVILCVHGPIYRVLSKVTAMLMHADAEAVRSSFPLALLITAATLALCQVIYRILDRFIPWSIGRSAAPRKSAS